MCATTQLDSVVQFLALVIASGCGYNNLRNMIRDRRMVSMELMQLRYFVTVAQLLEEFLEDWFSDPVNGQSHGEINVL